MTFPKVLSWERKLNPQNILRQKRRGKCFCYSPSPLHYFAINTGCLWHESCLREPGTALLDALRASSLAASSRNQQREELRLAGALPRVLMAGAQWLWCCPGESLAQLHLEHSATSRARSGGRQLLSLGAHLSQQNTEPRARGALGSLWCCSDTSAQRTIYFLIDFCLLILVESL